MNIAEQLYGPADCLVRSAEAHEDSAARMATRADDLYADYLADPEYWTQDASEAELYQLSRRIVAALIEPDAAVCVRVIRQAVESAMSDTAERLA